MDELRSTVHIHELFLQFTWTSSCLLSTLTSSSCQFTWTSSYQLLTLMSSSFSSHGRAPLNCSHSLALPSVHMDELLPLINIDELFPSVHMDELRSTVHIHELFLQFTWTSDECLKHSYSTRVSLSFPC